MFMVDKNT